MITTNKFNNIFRAALLIFVISTTSCIEQIELTPPAGLSDAIVIQGRAVLGENSRVEMNVSRLFDFSAESRLPLNVRDVIFSDDAGNSMELEPVNQGEYNTPIDASSPIQLEIGRGYKLSLQTFDGRSYESELDVLTDNKPSDNISYALTEEFVTNPIGNLEPVNRLEVFVDTELAQSSSGILWELDRTYRLTDSPPTAADPKTCYITNTVTVNSLPVINKDNLTSTLLQKKSLVTVPIDFRMAEGMYLTVRQYSLSQGAAKYWESSAVLVEREGGLFDDPVGLISTNFSNPNDPDDAVFGYFFSTKEEMIRSRIPAPLVGEIGVHCPPPPGPGGGDPCLSIGICCDCLFAPISTTQKPDYWID